MKKLQFRSYFDDLIAQNHVSQAINELKLVLNYINHTEDFDDSTSNNLQDMLDELILNQSVFETNERGHRLSIINENEYALTKSKCTNRLQALLGEISNKKNTTIVKAIEKTEMVVLLSFAKGKEDNQGNKNLVNNSKRLFYGLLSSSILALIAFFVFFNRFTKIDYFLVSAIGTGTNKTPWSNSEIHVNGGDIVLIEASGLVNLAIHHIIPAANADSLPKALWTNARGNSNYSTIQTIDNSREIFTLMNKVDDAVLLSAISNDDPHEQAEFFEEGEKKGWNYNIEIKSFNKLKEGSFVANKSGTLWFTVNDDWIPKDFFIGEHTNPEIKRKRAELLYPPDLEDQRIPKHIRDSIRMAKYTYISKPSVQYSNLWYDDNLGYYLLKISITRKRLNIF